MDYYTKTAFEIISNDIEHRALYGGGRYDGLIEQCGGPSTPGIGFGLGLERLLLILETKEYLFQKKKTRIIHSSYRRKADDKAMELLFELRRLSIKADKDYMDRSLKAQMKYG